MSIDWIAVDWGTSNLRAWAMDADDGVVAEAASAKGMGNLDRAGFEPALLELVADWLGDGAIDIVACGMVGARQGWVEAPYARVPAPPLGDGMVEAAAHDPRLRVHVIGGLSQDKPVDVMRGEETQIAGLLQTMPGFGGIVAMPGTHAKWVQIVDAEVFHFATFMTGELFDLLSTQSVLRHSVQAGRLDGAEFVEAFEAAMGRPERMAADLFSLRAEGLLKGADPARQSSRLSGLLLGLEFAAARPYWLGQDVVLMAADPLLELYRRAMEVVGVTPKIADPESCVLNGLRAARAQQTGRVRS